MIAGHFSSFQQTPNTHCPATSWGRGDVGCPALPPVPLSTEGGVCTFSAGNLWWLPGCSSPHCVLSRCKGSVWRRSFCEGECSLSVDMSEGRQTKKKLQCLCLNKNHHIRTRLRAYHGSIPAEAAPSQARTHSTHPCTVSPTHSGRVSNNLCLNLPFSSPGISGILKCASCYGGRFWLN